MSARQGEHRSKAQQQQLDSRGRTQVLAAAQLEGVHPPPLALSHNEALQALMHHHAAGRGGAGREGRETLG